MEIKGKSIRMGAAERDRDQDRDQNYLYLTGIFALDTAALSEVVSFIPEEC